MMTTGQRISAALALALGLGGGAAVAGGASFDASLEDRPCDILTMRMVAATFDVPEDELQQSQPIASWCAYEMEEPGETLNVSFSAHTYDTAAPAAEDFRNSTRSMTANELAETLKTILGEDDDDPDNIEKLIMETQPDGIQFEDVDGVAERARFETGEGALHLLIGNMRMTITAFHGPDMAMPNEFTAEAMMNALGDWKQETMSVRKEQAISLAKAVLAEL